VPRKFYFVLAVLAMTATACGGRTLASSAPRRGPISTSPAASSSTPSVSPEVYGNGFNRHQHAKAELASALVRAAADKRPIVLDFGADWCPNCTVVENAFHTNRVRTVLSKFHVVTVDVGRLNRNLDVARRYGLNVKATGIPALVVLSPAGKRTAEIDGGAFPNEPGIPPQALIAFLKRHS
jgi:thioredoxin 1